MLKSKKEGDKMQTFLENTLHQQIYHTFALVNDF